MLLLNIKNFTDDAAQKRSPAEYNVVQVRGCNVRAIKCTLPGCEFPPLLRSHLCLQHERERERESARFRQRRRRNHADRWGCIHPTFRSIHPRMERVHPNIGCTQSYEPHARVADQQGVSYTQRLGVIHPHRERMGMKSTRKGTWQVR
jgi:hypothetical protein